MPKTGRNTSIFYAFLTTVIGRLIAATFITSRYLTITDKSRVRTLQRNFEAEQKITPYNRGKQRKIMCILLMSIFSETITRFD